MSLRKSYLVLLILLTALSACTPGPTKEVPQEFKTGQSHFHKVCSNCHGSDALGGKTKAPNLIHRKFLPPDFTDEDIRDTIVNGSQSGKMPAQTAFNDQEITEIIKYLRHSQAAAGLEPEVEAEESDDFMEEEGDFLEETPPKQASTSATASDS